MRNIDSLMQKWLISKFKVLRKFKKWIIYSDINKNNDKLFCRIGDRPFSHKAVDILPKLNLIEGYNILLVTV